ncbi:hypothetical protein PQR34_47390 [Paraburkholderia sediminicola]|uniref:hypothetical protein n=1 Tax=Paraburkholderia sediminicola TaxID=458836 RepID=UPI0038B6D5FA
MRDAAPGTAGGIAPQWLDEVFGEHWQWQYPRGLVFSTTMERMTLVSLGAPPSLHAAATRTQQLSVSLVALYEKVNRTPKPRSCVPWYRAAHRVWSRCWRRGHANLPGLNLDVLDGNYVPASKKPLAELCEQRGAPPCPDRPWSSTSRIWDWLPI